MQHGHCGQPGELKGKFLSAHAIGSIRINGENGVYGTTRTGFSGQTMPVAFAQEVETGDAQILATVAGETPRTYHVRIEKISDADPRRNMVVRVVDKALLSRTGGIVQDERQSHFAEWAAGRRSDPCSRQRSDTGLRDFCADHVGAG